MKPKKLKIINYINKKLVILKFIKLIINTKNNQLITKN